MPEKNAGCKHSCRGDSYDSTNGFGFVATNVAGVQWTQSDQYFSSGGTCFSK
eukprot:m.39531 g.39531  ORF g.39531 m.39531 type:complete len:52 (-) comp14726_c0_seq3:989-1144(-)